MGMKQTNEKTNPKQIQNCRLKKLCFSKPPILNIFSKVPEIGPWVKKINWCKTFMVVRLSNIKSKTGKRHKKCIVSLVYALCWTAWRPCRLSHIDALCINLSYWPKDQFLKFLRIFFWELASSTGKSEVSWLARMSRNFNYYPLCTGMEILAWFLVEGKYYSHTWFLYTTRLLRYQGPPEK